MPSTWAHDAPRLKKYSNSSILQICYFYYRLENEMFFYKEDNF